MEEKNRKEMRQCSIHGKVVVETGGCGGAGTMEETITASRRERKRRGRVHSFPVPRVRGTGWWGGKEDDGVRQGEENGLRGGIVKEVR